jgi:hypothetical protein
MLHAGCATNSSRAFGSPNEGRSTRAFGCRSSSANPDIAAGSKLPTWANPVGVPSTVPKVTSAAADNTDTRCAADMRSPAAHMHSTAADMHRAPATAAPMTSAVTSAAVPPATCIEYGRRQKQARGDADYEKRGPQHDDPPLGAWSRLNVRDSRMVPRAGCPASAAFADWLSESCANDVLVEATGPRELPLVAGMTSVRQRPRSGDAIRSKTSLVWMVGGTGPLGCAVGGQSPMKLGQ